jgi:hypothetical protein
MLALLDGGEFLEIFPEIPIAIVGLLESGLIDLADEFASAPPLVRKEKLHLPVAGPLGAVATRLSALAIDPRDGPHSQLRRAGEPTEQGPPAGLQRLEPEL